MQLEVADIQETSKLTLRETSGKPRPKDGSATVKRKELYEPESPMIDFGKFASSSGVSRRDKERQNL